MLFRSRAEAVTLWEKLQRVELHPGTQDLATWRWTTDGMYSTASAYAVQFMGATMACFTTCTGQVTLPCAAGFSRGWQFKGGTVSHC